MAGLQTCQSRFDPQADRGLMLWDVTDPAVPVQIGYLRTACCTRGIHEFEIEHRADLGTHLRLRDGADVPLPGAGQPERISRCQR